MRILALIPARGGSKRLPRKNVRILGDKPLLIWSIDVCKGLLGICDILVSTDDDATAELARKAGALAPWLRPSELASDSATSADVALHALKWYQREKGAVDALLLLQPTSPFRTLASMQRGVELFQQYGGRPVVSVSKASSHPMWCMRVEGGKMKPFMEGGGLHLRSQDLPPAFVVNGSIYMIAPQDLMRHQSFYSDDLVPLEMSNPEEVIDIDTEYDWKIAESFLR